MSIDGFTNPWGSIQAHVANVERTRENSARPADSMCYVDSTGSGEIMLSTVLKFECVFAQEPHVSYGYRIDEELGDELVDGQLPRSHGFVFDWQTNAVDQYLGAYVGMAVDIPAGDLSPSYAIRHYFRFEGIAIKNLSSDPGP